MRVHHGTNPGRIRRCLPVSAALCSRLGKRGESVGRTWRCVHPVAVKIPGGSFVLLQNATNIRAVTVSRQLDTGVCDEHHSLPALSKLLWRNGEVPAGDNPGAVADRPWCAFHARVGTAPIGIAHFS